MKKVLKFPTLNAKVIITQDENMENPRTAWDNLGKCIFFGKHNHLGDNHNINADDYNGFDQMANALKRKGASIILPVYMYSHSGQTIKTTPFSCPWDSGQLGFIVAYAEDLRKEYSVKRVTKKIIETATSVLEAEIEILDQHIGGDVWQFKAVNTVTNESDYCGGFYGDDTDNGIFDHLDIEGLTREMYNSQYLKISWE